MLLWKNYIDGVNELIISNTLTITALKTKLF